MNMHYLITAAPYAIVNLDTLEMESTALVYSRDNYDLVVEEKVIVIVMPSLQGTSDF